MTTIGTVSFKGFWFSKSAYVSISYPDNPWVNSNNSWVKDFRINKDRMEVTGVMFDGRGNPKIQGSSLRSPMRQIALDIFITPTTKFDRWSFGLLRQGSSNKTVEDRRMNPQKTLELRQKNPLISLFGVMDTNSTLTVDGKLKMGDSFATDLSNASVDNEYVVWGDPLDVHPRLDIVSVVRSDMFVRNPKYINHLENPDELETMRETEKQASSLKKEVKKLKREKATFSEIQEVNKAQKELAEQSDQDTRTATQQLHSYYAIPANTVFKHEFRIISSTDMELGLMLNVLSKFNDMSIGGISSRGGGGFNKHFAYEVEIDGEYAGMVQFDGEFKVVGEILESAMAVFDSSRLNLPDGGLYITPPYEGRQKKSEQESV